MWQEVSEKRCFLQFGAGEWHFKYTRDPVTQFQ